MRLLLLLVLLLPVPDDEYFVGKKKVDLADIVDSGGKIYIRARALREHEIKVLWRVAADEKSVGVVWEGIGGALEIGNGKPALIHSGDMFFTLDALSDTLNIKVEREILKITIDPKKKANPQPRTPKLASLVPGDRMIDLTFPKVKGDPFNFAKAKKRILLVLWASWDPSRMRLREWQKYYERTKRDQFLIVAAAQDVEGAGRVVSFAEGTTFPVLVDARHRLEGLFGASALPQWIFIDEQGFVRAAGGSLPDEAVIARLLTEEGDHREVGKAWIADPGETSKGTEREAVLRQAADFSAQGKTDEAVSTLKRFLRDTPADLLLRRQKWALEFPDKIYAPTIDEAWMKEQEEREKQGG